MTMRNATLHIADSIQRYRLGEMTDAQYRESMAYIRGRLSDSDYNKAKFNAIALEEG